MEKPNHPSRGEVWMVDLDPTVGREQAGSRPALVISVDQLNRSAAELAVLIPLTSRDKGIRSHVPIQQGEAGLQVKSFVKCEDIRSVSAQRLKQRWGKVSNDTLAAVEERLRILLGL